MNIAFVPVWNSNPYHAELKGALESLGHRVLFPESLKSLHADFMAGREQLDVLHVHALPYLEMSLTGARRYVMFFRRLSQLQKRGVRLVLTVHDFQNHDSRCWRIEEFTARRLSRRLDAVIVHGETARRIVRDGWPAHACKRIVVISHGNYLRSYPNDVSKTVARETLGLNASDFVFLFLGLIRPYKGVEQMIKAFKSCEGSDLRLIIAGRPETDAIQKEVELLVKSDSRIRCFPGSVEPERIQHFMNASDVAVLPYRRVFTSGVAILAMSFGKPCIAPRAGCVPDVLNEQGGVLFDPAAEGDLERAFAKMIGSRQHLANMGRYNLDRARSWDWKSIGRQTAALYEDCLKSNGSGAGGNCREA